MLPVDTLSYRAHIEEIYYEIRYTKPRTTTHNMSGCICIRHIYYQFLKNYYA